MSLTPYYQDSAVTIYHGDCREILPQLDVKVDLVLTDPPYGVGLIGKRAKQRGGGQKIREDTYSFADTPDYVRDIVLPAIETCRGLAASLIVTPGVRNMWAYPQPDDVGCFFTATGTGVGRWGFTCMSPILYYGKDPFLALGLGSRANSCGQTYPNDANQQAHPCAKPLRMVKWLVWRGSMEGGLVLDPFMGSGTTLVAAQSLGRKSIGIEIEEKYCRIAVERLRQKPLFLTVPTSQEQ